jgi:glycosyltransferase involved in cell wall biosynthesis
MGHDERREVSVLLLTYNHREFIAQCVESALKQTTTFRYEIVIADDCSSDGTREIVQQYARHHPDMIQILPRTQRLGVCGSFFSAYTACRGRYVAILEGDDYWSSPAKLEMLAAALDAHPEASLAFHDVRILLHQSGEEKERPFRARSSMLTLEDFLTHNFVLNCSSVMYRNALLSEIPDWAFTLSYYDWTLHLLNLEHGHALHVPACLSVYRVHQGGAWHGALPSDQCASIIELFTHLNRHFDYRYDSLIQLQIRYCALVARYERHKARPSARRRNPLRWLRRRIRRVLGPRRRISS